MAKSAAIRIFFSHICIMDMKFAYAQNNINTWRLSHLIARALLIVNYSTTRVQDVGESLDLTVWSSFVPSTLPGLSSG